MRKAMEENRKLILRKKYVSKQINKLMKGIELERKVVAMKNENKPCKK